MANNEDNVVIKINDKGLKIVKDGYVIVYSEDKGEIIVCGKEGGIDYDEQQD